MGLLVPSALLALVAAVVPYLVHRIGRRQPTPVRFAAMQLLLRAERRVRARQKLREILLLIARTAAAAALPLIFARPYVERESDAPLAAMTTQSAVILLDDSASMRRRVGGTSLWERARDRARAVIRQLPSGSAVALVTASAGAAAPVGELTMEKSRVLQALDKLSCSARPAEFASAIRRASVILAGAPHEDKRVFLFTDLQDAGWEAGTGLPERDPPDLVIVDATQGTRGQDFFNRAIVDMQAAPEPDLGPGGIAVVADIADWGSQTVKSLGVTLLVDGTAVTKGFVDVPANGRARKRFVHALSAEAGGVHEIEVRIDGDSFPLDDSRRASLAMTQALRVLLVNGDARTERTEDELFFFESALTSAGAGLSVTAVLPDDVGETDLDRIDVVVMANVAAPSAELAANLTRFVAEGGGLFVSVGDKVNADVWNTRMGGLLPQPLGLIRTAASQPGSAAGETVDDRPAERLAPLDRQHPLLTAYSARGDGLTSARFFKYMLLEPVPDDSGRKIVLRFESGAPALVERTITVTSGEERAGRVMLLATTIDREWTDLPIRPGFLPLVLEATRRLGGASRGGPSSTLLVGEPRSFVMSGEQRRLEVSRPDGQIWVVNRRPSEPAKTVTFRDTHEPGTYHVRIALADNNPSQRPDETFVVNLDPRESVAIRVPPERRPDRSLKTSGGGQRPSQREPLWHGLATLVIALIAAESLLTLRRRAVTGRSLDSAA